MSIPPLIPPLMGQKNIPSNSPSQQNQIPNKPQPLMSIPFESKNQNQPQGQPKSLLGAPPPGLQPIQQQPTPLMSIKPNGKLFSLKLKWIFL